MVLTYLVSPAIEPLSQASFRALPLTTLFLLALATAKKSWGATGSLFHGHLCGWGCLPFLHPAVCRQVGVAHPLHPSLLLGEVLSRLCGWSWYRPPTMPSQGSPLVSASGQVFVSRSPSPFRVPSPFFYERGVVLLGEVIAAARAARPQVGSLRAHNVRSVSTSVAFHRHWSVASILDQPLGPPDRCFLNIILATFNTNLMVYFLLVTSWLRVLG